jgi:hypothetical protein
MGLTCAEPGPAQCVLGLDLAPVPERVQQIVLAGRISPPADSFDLQRF